MAGKNNNEGLGGLLSAVLAQAQIIQAADNVTDDKSNNLMAAALVVITLLAAQVTARPVSYEWLTIAAMVILVGVIGLVIYLTRTREYLGAVVDLEKYPEYYAYEDDQLLAQLIEDATDANAHNEKILANKQRFFRISVVLFLFGFALGVASLFVSA